MLLYVLSLISGTSTVTRTKRAGSMLSLIYLSLNASFSLFSVLGKRLGRDMGVVAKKVKEMSLDDILAFEKSGEVVISGHSLKLSDIKVYIHLSYDKYFFVLYQL